MRATICALCLCVLFLLVAADNVQPRRPAIGVPRGASKPATTTFAKVGTSTTIFILETRGSMLPALDEIQQELGKAINLLPADVGFNLVWFENEEPKYLSPSAVLATDINKRLAYAAVLEAPARGAHDGRGLAKAIGKAHAMKADTVWLISIGFPTQGECDLAAILIGKLQIDNMKINTTVRYVESSDEKSRVFLLDLAERTHGVSIGRNGEIIKYASDDAPSGERIAPLPATLPTGPSIFREK